MDMVAQIRAIEGRIAEIERLMTSPQVLIEPQGYSNVEIVGKINTILEDLRRLEDRVSEVEFDVSQRQNPVAYNDPAQGALVAVDDQPENIR